MYRQEHRFSPATSVLGRFDVWYAAYISVPFPVFFLTLMSYDFSISILLIFDKQDNTHCSCRR